MLQPNKNIKKAVGTGKKVLQSSAISQVLSKVPFADEVYDVANVFEGLREGDYKKIGSNFIGALIPGVSGKAFEAIAEDWLPPTPEIEKKKMQFNLQSSPAERQELLKKYGPGYLSNPQFIKDQKLAYGTGNQGIMKRKMNPRKKYANGTNPTGVGPNNYIQSPNEVLNDYNIMLAKVDQEVASNPLVPIVSLVGGLAQQAISFGGQGGFNKGALTTPPKTAANGMNDVNSDVEVEGGEMYETPQGETGEFQGPSHEQGGMPMEVGQDIPEGTKVYSDRLKVGKETLAERKEKREKQIANLEKIASEPLVDSAMKNATKRKMAAIQKEEMGDLQFQEQVNNMQQMADNVIAAFGTSVAGLQANPMKYADGTGPAGIKYGKGYDESMFKDFYAKYNELNPGGVMDMNFIQGDLGMDSKTPGFGKMFGPGTYKASQDWLTANKDKMPDGYVNPIQTPAVAKTNPIVDTGAYGAPGFVEGFGMEATDAAENPMYYDPNPESKSTSNPNIDYGKLLSFSVDGINDNASLDYGDPYAKDGVNFEMPKETIMTPADQYGKGVSTDAAPEVDLPGTMLSRGLAKAGTAVNKMGGVPGMGDLVGMFGNYLGATSGLKNAAEQRSTDITHRNVYANAGKESQKQLDNAMSSIENAKTQAIVKATTTTQGGKKSGRNSARGINQKRGMDWLYDTALNEQIAQISSNAATQVSDIYKAKSGVAMNVDQLKGQGEYQANMANEAAKDAYYTAKGLGLKDQALGVQHIGKDLNSMKQNKMIENLMKDYGKWFKTNGKGEVVNKNEVVSQNKTTTKTENASSALSEALKSMNITSDNAGYVTLPNGKKVKESEILTLFSNTK
jgi:hypothetical protein